MSTLIARTGRHQQRYQDQLRLVAGCIPYKFNNNVKDGSCNVENMVLVLMISTPNRDDLVFPKGGWEDDETLDEAACREALEEAGVKGRLGENPLGVWEFRSKKRQNSCSSEGGCRGYMFALEVTEELDHWPEQQIYTRKWLAIDEAFRLCRYDWMRDALKMFQAELSNLTRKESPELGAVTVSNIEAETQMFAPGICSGKPSSVQQLAESSSKCVVQV